MAEFTEVMKQHKRMCKACKGMCSSECEFGKAIDKPAVGERCWYMMKNFPSVAERIIMKWAAEHLEPQYPTWKQWMQKTFPNAEDCLTLCNFDKVDRTMCHEKHCKECEMLRIPADIAEKLGIKPGEEWE